MISPADPYHAIRDTLRSYHERDPWLTWRRLLPTLALWIVAWPLLFAPGLWDAMSPMLAVGLRLLLGLLVAGLMLRICSISHDWAHGAVLRGSRVARRLLRAVAVVLLAPVRIWGDTHHPHHDRANMLGVDPAGAFPLWTVTEYRTASPTARWGYRLLRSPLTFLLAWPAVFLVKMNLLPFLANPRRHIDCGAALGVHGGLNVLALVVGGWETWWFAIAVPYGIMGAIGGYMFYAQHHFPGTRWYSCSSWRYEAAAIHGSSYMAMPAWAHWFTGNIGFHHIHHFDPRVPFYALPRVWMEVPAFQRPPDTSWAMGDIVRAFSVALWDESGNRAISWSEYAQLPVPALGEAVLSAPSSDGGHR